IIRTRSRAPAPDGAREKWSGVPATVAGPSPPSPRRRQPPIDGGGVVLPRQPVGSEVGHRIHHHLWRGAHLEVKTRTGGVAGRALEAQDRARLNRAPPS